MLRASSALAAGSRRVASLDGAVSTASTAVLAVTRDGGAALGAGRAVVVDEGLHVSGVVCCAVVGMSSV